MILILPSTSEMKIEGFMFVSQNLMGFFKIPTAFENKTIHQNRCTRHFVYYDKTTR